MKRFDQAAGRMCAGVRRRPSAKTEACKMRLHCLIGRARRRCMRRHGEYLRRRRDSLFVKLDGEMTMGYLRDYLTSLQEQSRKMGYLVGEAPDITIEILT